MDADPPADFLAYVATRLDPLRREAARRCGGDGTTAAAAVLADLAGHWRRLEWKSRLHRRDVRGDYLARRMALRTEECSHPVEVTVRPGARPGAPGYRRAAPASVAQRLAALLPTTVRADTGAVADAEIAWVHAYRRHLWRHYARLCAGGVLLVGGLVHVMSRASGAG
ncbi:hypothetical protein [Couchioplanes azureus]|uniref:hypothetical protein n=1 Tax=Couchioplanes caeruleus TaxID=56438 RepID=UPI001670E109|nr:hypothetical protein [Couchioplanes caeruleus]GGQ53946.1 hypothetical protein GCM10010166_23490 [Couchioplanes caeruleus subsp. azureus]